MAVAKAYLANQFGFSETGRYLLENLIKPRISDIGIIINDPFLECGKEVDFVYLSKLQSYDGKVNYWAEFSRKVTPINNQLMQDSDCLLALLDGGPAVDDGVASEIGYYAGIARGPIFALRSDFRCGENIAVSINPQVLGYILQSKGSLVDGPDAINRWIKEIEKWYDSFSEKCITLLTL